MSRAETIALIDDVLSRNAVTNVGDFKDLINDEDGARLFLDACRAAAAQPPPPVNTAPPVNVSVTLQVVPPPPPSPPPISLLLQVAVPAAPTATVGITTERISMHNAQAQTARWLYGITQAVQTITTALMMVDGSTTTEGMVSTANADTDTYMDSVSRGLSHISTQTERRVVLASDHDALGAELVASVLEAQKAATALVREKAALDGLVTAIINRKRIDMNGARYNVWCEGEAETAGDAPDGVYVLPSRPLVLG